MEVGMLDLQAWPEGESNFWRRWSRKDQFRMGGQPGWLVMDRRAEPPLVSSIFHQKLSLLSHLLHSLQLSKPFLQQSNRWVNSNGVIAFSTHLGRTQSLLCYEIKSLFGNGFKNSSQLFSIAKLCSAHHEGIVHRCIMQRLFKVLFKTFNNYSEHSKKNNWKHLKVVLKNI